MKRQKNQHTVALLFRNRRAFKPQTVAFFAVLTFASTTVMLADLYYPGPNTTDLQGQWINATTSPPGGPPVYGTPGPADDVDLEGVDITASGGSVRSIYNVGSVSVTGMVSAVETSEFTLRGSGTLNVDHVRPISGLGVVGGHLKATGAGDFVDVSGGGSVTAATCRGGSFRDGSSLTLTGTGGPGGSANFRSGSSLIAMAGLNNFSFTLSGASLAHIASYTFGNVYINDAGSVLTVDQAYSINSGNLAITLGGSAIIQGPMQLSGGLVSIDGDSSRLKVQNVQINGGDLQINGGLGLVDTILQMPRGHIGIHNGGSLDASQIDIGGGGSPAIVDLDNRGVMGGAVQLPPEMNLKDNGVLNANEGGRLGVRNLDVRGGTLNVAMGGDVIATNQLLLTIGAVVISGGRVQALTTSFLGTAALQVNDGGRLTGAGMMSVSFGRGTVSGNGSLLSYPTITIQDTVPSGTLLARENGLIKIDAKLAIGRGGGVSTASGGSIIIGATASTVGEVRVGPGGTLDDNGAVICTSATILPGGILTGTGTINGRLFSSGWILPGNSTGILIVQSDYTQNSDALGILTVQGDYTQNSDGLLSIEIGGTDAGTGYDQLQVSGAASITGNLQVRLVNGFTPIVGQTYRIVNAGSLSGGFSSITQPSQAGISVSNDGGGVTVTITSVVAGAPVISSPTTVAATQGQAFSYQITATNNPTSFGAMNLPDGLTVDHATGLISGTPTIAGNYVVPMAANNNAGSGQADLIIGVGPPAVTNPSQLLNISTRMRVLSGDNALIGGMIATGTAGKRVIIRAIGPSLTAFGVPGALGNPTLDLFQGSMLLFSNDDWNNSSQQAEIAASGFAPGNALESAIIWTLTPGQGYTAIVRGINGTTGVGVVEVYDLNQAAASKLGNISTRGFVDVDDNVMIAGLIAGPGNGTSLNVLVRALGPTLSDFGVPGALANPTLDLVNASGTVIRSNNNWKDDPQQRALIEAAGLAPAHDEEAALVETIAPGAYTAIVRGNNRTTGVGLVEVYKLP
ncbi:MAG: hypothetical protein QOC70_2867 [Verrucomicrobiota bacterium]